MTIHPLQPRDRVAVVAPSSPFPRETFLAGLAWLSQRYELVLGRGVFSRIGYLAGTDERRGEELAWALTDPSIHAVLVARGGYGATRLLPRLASPASPRWLVGFSDATALLVRSDPNVLGLVHGPNVTGLGGGAGRSVVQNRAALLAALERPDDPRTWKGLTVVRPGAAEGPAFGGNLTLLFTLAATGCLHVPRGAVLFLEDVTERPYRVDRMLTALRDGGYLAEVAAVVFGSFERCEASPADGVSVEEVLTAWAATLGVPVVADAPFGHGARNEAFRLGARASLAGETLRWSG